MQIIKISNDIVEIDDIRYSIKEDEFAPCRLCCFRNMFHGCKIPSSLCERTIGFNHYFEKIESDISHSPTLPDELL